MDFVRKGWQGGRLPAHKSLGRSVARSRRLGAWPPALHVSGFAREKGGFFLANFFTPVTLGMREGIGECGVGEAIMPIQTDKIQIYIYRFIKRE